MSSNLEPINGLTRQVAELLTRKDQMPQSQFGDGYDALHVDSMNRLPRRF